MVCRAVWSCVAVLALAGCGATAGPSAPAPPGAAGERATPALAARPARTGEIVVRGDASPRTHGPFDFDGRYRVRFEQYAPEDPALDFAGQVPFTAALTVREGDPRGATELFAAAGGSGLRELTIRGRRFVDVSFGDFPYVIRLTPRPR